MLNSFFDSFPTEYCLQVKMFVDAINTHTS
jgi:hypothetical protein